MLLSNKTSSSLNKLYDLALEQEKYTLAPYAFFSKETKGRYDGSFYEKTYRLPFHRDRDEIIHSKYFRRLKGKTQVFLAPIGDHYRTRLTHTLEVSQIARTIGKALRLNETLIEAIALGHDLGHTPFGHMGEKAINKIKPFHHAIQSEKIAKKLNLSIEVGKGIRQHSKGKNAILGDELKGVMLLEAQVVRVSDIIAYLNHDFDDAVRGGLLKEDYLPEKVLNILGKTKKERFNTMINSIIFTSLEEYERTQILDRIYIESEVLEAIDIFRQFMFEEVYESKRLLKDLPKVEKLIYEIYHYFMMNKEIFIKDYEKLDKFDTNDIEERIIDYIAGMTDNFAIYLYNILFLPKKWDIVYG